MAKRISEEFKSWYEANILVTNKRLRFIDAELIEKNRQEKTYEEGFTADGGVVLDASRYGVTNIYEAVQLFKDFLHF